MPNQPPIQAVDESDPRHFEQVCAVVSFKVQSMIFVRPGKLFLCYRV